MAVNSDRTYELVIHSPPATFLIKQAAGIDRGAMYPGKEISGKITLKHLYEIAKIKLEDPPNALLSLEVGISFHAVGYFTICRSFKKKNLCYV